jgi:hypothetical protein
MKPKVKKSILFILATVLGAFFIIKLLSKPLPDAVIGPRADEIAIKVQETLNFSGYEKLNQISFGYRGHNYLWNKKENRVLVFWKDYKVDLNLSDIENSTVVQSDVNENRSKLIEKAKAYFYNDSYWLVAPFKFFDPGVVRGVVETEKGDQALLITHTSGGVTPGDSYLWHLDEDYRPTHFELWVSIIPIKGISATWTDWVTKQGVSFATNHKIGPLNITIADLVVE